MNASCTVTGNAASPAAHDWRQPRSAGSALAVSVALLTVGAALVGCGDKPPPSPDKGVQAGREALSGSWRYPWYDGSADAVRRINVRPTRQSSWPWWEWLLENLAWIAIWTAVAIAVALLVWLLIAAWRRRGMRWHGSEEPLDARATAERTDAIENLPFEIDAATGDLLALARRCYERGDYGRAMVYLFSHELVELDRRHMILLAKGKTNRQYLRELRSWPALSAVVDESMRAFEDFFFGNHAIDRARFESCWRRLDEFSKLLAAEGAA